MLSTPWPDGMTERPDSLLCRLPPASRARVPVPAHAAPESDGRESPGLDLLSDVLRGVRLTAAVFFRVEAASPWVIEIPDGATLARSVVARAQRVVSYHVVTGGTCWGVVAGETPLPPRPVTSWSSPAATHM
jgi:Cupin